MTVQHATVWFVKDLLTLPKKRKQDLPPVLTSPNYVETQAQHKTKGASQALWMTDTYFSVLNSSNGPVGDKMAAGM